MRASQLSNNLLQVALSITHKVMLVAQPWPNFDVTRLARSDIPPNFEPRLSCSADLLNQKFQQFPEPGYKLSDSRSKLKATCLNFGPKTYDSLPKQ
jgi:hypothetical protein